jgi:tRNA threonylcarbamoyl adenosine modification protein (Sua5/YciO/YrdC/YwlC family)
MIKRFHIHPHNPQMRLLAQVSEFLNRGQLMVYPTDATYALGCKMDALEAQARLRMIRQLDKNHGLTLVCKDLSEVSEYAQVNNRSFRLLKKYTPGPCTFILPGSSGLPRRLADPKRKTIGLRVPDHPVIQALLELLGAPLLSATAQLPGDDLPLSDPDVMESALAKQVDILIDAGAGTLEPTTVIDLTSDEPKIIRLGAGLFHD